MPRTVLEPRFQVEYLSILDSDGNLDASLEPDIPGEDLKRLYRGMLLGRRLDERMIRLQRQGRIGTFAPIKGQEASQIGAVSTLRPSDWMVPSFRETAAMPDGIGPGRDDARRRGRAVGFRSAASRRRLLSCRPA